MTVPLFDVKARLSEYVTMVEQGEVIIITKHGKGSVLLISEESMKEWVQRTTTADSRLKEWRTKFADCLSDDYADLLSDIRNERWSAKLPPFNETSLEEGR